MIIIQNHDIVQQNKSHIAFIVSSGIITGMNAKKNKRSFRRGIRPIRLLPIGYLAIILLGTLMFMLPVSSAAGPMGFMDALFTAVSASCVTGLSTIDVANELSSFGQAVLLLLIQVGGLGFMTFATVLFGVLRRNLTLLGRMSAAEALGEDGTGRVKELCAYAIKYSIVIELIGAAVLYIRFRGSFAPLKALWFSVFHSISAFCNAGFDLMGNFESFTRYCCDPLVCLTLSALIILGGIGFAVIHELMHARKLSPLSQHTKTVLVTTAALLIAGFVFNLAAEWSNPGTFAELSVPNKLLAAWFQSATLRTAGFNTVDQLALRDGTKLFNAILMFIGGAPAGTAGGIKVTSLAVLLLTTRAFLRNSPNTTVFGRSVSPFAVRRALCVFFIGLSAALLSIAAISFAMPDAGFINTVYEVFSAIGTVGLSSGITSAAPDAVKLLLCMLMFIGRAGILTVALAIGGKSNEAILRYPEGNIMIG